MNELLIYIFVSLLILFWIAEPLLRRKTSGASAADMVVQERIEGLLESLRTIHQTHEREKMLDKDFENIKNGLMVELAKLYERQGLNPEQRVNADTCECGAPLQQEFSFCPVCGRGLKAA